MKQNPIKREAIEHLYAYSAIKGALMSGEDEARSGGDRARLRAGREDAARTAPTAT